MKKSSTNWYEVISKIHYLAKKANHQKIYVVCYFFCHKKREGNKNKIDSNLIKYFKRLVEMTLKRELEIINL